MGGVKRAITVCGPLKAKRPLEDVLSEAMSNLLSVIYTLMPEQWAQEEHLWTQGSTVQDAVFSQKHMSHIV